MGGEETPEKISQMTLESWNYKGHDPQQFRHYGPTAQDFFAAFGDDGFGTIGTDTTINSGDMAGIMMIAIQALKRAQALGTIPTGRWAGTHTLRHSAARHWLASGVPINHVSRWLGHASIQTTLIYLEILPDPVGYMDRVP